MEPAPARKSRVGCWVVAIGLPVLALVCIGVLLLSGKALVDLSGPSGTSTAIVQSTPPRTDTPRLTEVTDQDGRSMIVWRVLDPAPASRLYAPKEGQRVVAVEVTVTNISSDEEVFVSPLRFQLIDTNGAVYDGSLASTAAEITTAHLTRGSSRTGLAGFILPNGVQAATLRFWVRDQRLFDGPFISVDLAP